MDSRKSMRAEVGDTGTTRVRVTLMGYTITYVHATQAPQQPSFTYGC